MIDPASGRDEVNDLWIRDGRIIGIGVWDEKSDLPRAVRGTVKDTEILDARGLIVCPGWIDARVSLREPGLEEDETIACGTAAAVAGGFTTVGCLPDTDPVVDNRAAAEFIARQGERAGFCRVIPIGAVTKNRDGKELAEMGQLMDGGAATFSDAKRPIGNAEVMRRALQYAAMWNKPILHHAQVPELVAGGVMHEGFYSTMLGLRGMPAAAEEIMVRRDIALAEATGGAVHLMAVSSRRSVEEIRDAQQRGVRVTADVTPHHLLLTDESLLTYDSDYKVDPPLRTPEDIVALISGLKDGTISVMSSDHQPHAEEKRTRELDQAPFGIIGLETALPLSVEALITPGHLTWSELIAKWTVGPAKLLGRDLGRIAVGDIADITVIDPAAKWQIDSSQFRSKSRNTPFHGRAATGRVIAAFVGGRRAARE